MTGDVVDASPGTSEASSSASVRVSTAQTASWRAAVASVFGLAGLGFATWASRLPSVRELLGLSPSGVTLLVFTLAAGSVVGLGLAPLLTARVPSRTLLRWALGCLGGSLLLIGASSSLMSSTWLLVVGVLIFGTAYGANDVVMNVEGALVERALGRSALPLMHAFFSIGAVVGASVGAGALALGVGTFAHLAVVGTCILVAGILVCARVPRSEPARAASAARPSISQRMKALFQPLRERRVVWLSLVTAGVGLTEGAATGWLVLASTDGHGLPKSTAAVVYGVFISFMILGRLVGGTLLDKLGPGRTLALLLAVAGVGIATFVQTLPLALVFISVALWGLGASLGFPIVLSAASGDGARAAQRVSLIAFFGYVSALAGPPALGLIGARVGLLNSFYLVLALLALALLAVPGALRRQSADR